MLILNGVLMSEAAATLPATDRALTHGLGLYETHQARGRRARLLRGAHRPPRAGHRGARARQGHRQARAGRAGLPPQRSQRRRPQLLPHAGHGRGAGRRARPSSSRPTGATFPPRPLRVISYRGVRVSAQYKAMTVMQSTFAQRAARAAGVDDAILVDGEGRIFEGATSNVFVVRAGGLITPPAEGDILPGVMRAKVEQVATAAGMPVVEAWARVADLRPDDGVLLTSSVRGVVPVERVDERAAAGARAGADEGARARRGCRGGERRRLPRDLPLRPPRQRGLTPAGEAGPASRGYVCGRARNDRTMRRFLAIITAAVVLVGLVVARHRRGAVPRKRQRRVGDTRQRRRQRRRCGDRRADDGAPGGPAPEAALHLRSARVRHVPARRHLAAVRRREDGAHPHHQERRPPDHALPRHLEPGLHRQRAGPALHGIRPAATPPTGASTSTTPT